MLERAKTLVELSTHGSSKAETRKACKFLVPKSDEALANTKSFLSVERSEHTSEPINLRGVADLATEKIDNGAPME